MRGLITAFAIIVVIDDKSFSITASHPTRKIRDELEAFGSEHIQKQEKRADLYAELTFLQKDYTINESLLKSGSVVEKAKGWLEQRECNEKIYTLQKELKAINVDLEKSEISLEDIHAKRFDLLVSGDDKVALKQEIINKNILFVEVNNYIGELIQSEKEKN